jgi:hypothetical protein
MHPAYQRIIRLGSAAVPMILRRLAVAPGRGFGHSQRSRVKIQSLARRPSMTQPQHRRAAPVLVQAPTVLMRRVLPLSMLRSIEIDRKFKY